MKDLIFVTEDMTDNNWKYFINMIVDKVGIFEVYRYVEEIKLNEDLE